MKPWQIQVLWVLVIVTFVRSAWDIGVLEKRVKYLEHAMELEQKWRLDFTVPPSAQTTGPNSAAITGSGNVVTVR